MEHGTHQAPDQDPRDSVVIPTFYSLHDQLEDKLISTYWYDDVINAQRVFRPSYERLRGEGASLVMPLAASWMSSGPDADPATSNVVVFPANIDRTAVDYMQRTEVLGEHDYLHQFNDFPALAEKHDKPIYNVDDLPDAWDQHSANKAETVRRVNIKKELGNLSSFAAPYEIVDVRTTTVDDFARHAGTKGVVYVKLNNTENSGSGVIICRSAEQYMQAVEQIRTQADAYGLDYEIVVQPHVEGENRSFQYFMTPDDDKLHLVAHSRQFVENDGKTYAASENFPLTQEAVTEDLANMMVDMTRRIRAIDPKAFGFVMCDYFHREGQPPLTFDPGLRPTGNTATALARLWAEEIDGRKGWHSALFGLSGEQEKRQMSFEEYKRPAEKLFGPDALVTQGACVMPWGFNQYQGRGVLIGLGRTHDAMQEVIAEVQRVLHSS